METDSPDSWNEYERELERRRSGLLIRLLPETLARSIYTDLFTDLDRADSRRSNAKVTYDTAVDRARSITDDIDDLLRGPSRRGESLPEDSTDRSVSAESVLADLDGLRKENRQFLTASEQSTVEERRSDLRAALDRLHEKREHDKELSELDEGIDTVAETVELAIDCDGLVPISTITERIDEIERANDWVREAKYAVDTTLLSEADLARYQNRHDRLSDLESLLVGTNFARATEWYHSHLDDCKALRDSLSDALDPARTNGDSLPRSETAIRADIDEAVSQARDFLESNAPVYLSARQQRHLEAQIEALEETASFVRAKARFDRLIEQHESTLSEVESTMAAHCSDEQYLTSSKQQSLGSQLASVIDDLAAVEDGLHLLADADRDRFDKLQRTLSDLQKRVQRHNERLVETKREEYADTFSGFGDEDLSLNAKQELAVYRNDRHNRVIAGAGTGKTFSLACRVKYLVEEGVDQSDSIALTFTNDAADEMKQRFGDMFGLYDVEASTMHSLGRRILSEEAPEAVQLGETPIQREVGELIRQLQRTDETFAHHYEEFLEARASEELSDDHEDRSERVERLEKNNTKTLGGEEIDSDLQTIQRVHGSIADMLFEHEIEYRYKQFAPWATPDDGEAYVPDFTLPNHDIDVVYLPSASVRQQRRTYKRKRSAEAIEDLYEDVDRTLVLVSGEDVREGRVAPFVRAQLHGAGVKFDDPLTGQDRTDRVYEQEIMWREVEDLFTGFVTTAKTNQVDPHPLLEDLSKEDNDQYYHFSHAGVRVLQAYTERLDRQDIFDFIDMIVEAATVIRSGAVDALASYKHVLVDEFQDLNQAQIDFVKAMLSRHEDSRLFAVGDDWQSIYGFKGARPDYFIDFREHFESTTDTELVTNYRCPPSVVQAGNTLIEHNDAKTDKDVEAFKSLQTSPRVHPVPGKDDYQYRKNAVNRIVELVEQSLGESDRTPDDILILTRTRKGIFYKLLRSSLSDHVPVGGSNGVTVTTAHQSKGTEASHVLVANVVDGSGGFPNPNRESLTRLVELDTGSHEDEERRLFYVALTRAEERLDIQTRAHDQSPFVGEIDDHTTIEPCGVDCRENRSTVEGRVTQERESKPNWSTRQMGDLLVDGEYELKFIIDDEATNVPLLDQHGSYRLDNVGISTYEGDPQLEIDEKTTVRPL